MYKKIYSVIKSLDTEFSQFSLEVDTYVGNIMQWADELQGIIEKEFTGGRGSPSFQLPKTPCERKARNRKARNALVSKCSVLDSAVDSSEITNLDDTISTRTRAARRAVTSKISQLNTIKGNKDIVSVESKRETKVMRRNVTEESSNATFVMPHNASTRTKPVLKNEQKDAVIPEPASSIVSPSRNKVSETFIKTPVERPSRKRVSRNLSESPIERHSRKKVLMDRSKSPEGRHSRKKNSGNDIHSPIKRPSREQVSKTSIERRSRMDTSKSLIKSPVVPSSKNSVSRSHSESPLLRSSNVKGSRTLSCSPLVRSGSVSTGLDRKLKEKHSISDRTVTIKKGATSTGIGMNISMDNEEKTPKVKGGKFIKLSKTSTPVVDGEKTPVVDFGQTKLIELGDQVVNMHTEADAGLEINKDVTYSVDLVTSVKEEEDSEEQHVPKKKRKLKKNEETFKENIEEGEDTGRITRTKSKAIKQMMEEKETKQGDLSAFAKKLVNRAKMTSLKKNQLAALLESNNTSTPKNGMNQNIPFGALTSKSKYHLLLSSSKKFKTPLATLPNSVVKIAKSSENSDKLKSKVAKEDTIENVIKSAHKLPKDDVLEREIKLNSKKEKEEEAAIKRQNALKIKQEALKRKNELKHQQAMKQREKLEQEKYNNMVQSEKEKEERHKIILQERQMKLKEEAFKKKMLTQQKIAETVERRRLEEEARIAKLKEMEAEEERIALEKQKEQERLEKRAQERLAEKKAREEYELQLKQELEAERLRAEKTLTAKKFIGSASKMQSASKRQKLGIFGEKREWDYKPRNENDYGLEDEYSEVDSEDERSYDKSRPPMPWGKKIMNGKGPFLNILTLEMLSEFMPCYQKTPDVHKMFKMTPSKRIKRTSSAIWNTPSS